MRNRISQPHALNVNAIDVTPIRIYGQLVGPMQRPEAGVKIMLKAITTNQLIVQDTWNECTTDQSGNYDFSVPPGKYAVFFERRGLKNRVNNIQVYGDSAPGDLQTFMLAPLADTLTPLMTQEVMAALDLSKQAVLRSRQWAENPVDVPVLDFEQGEGPEYSAYHWAHKAKEAINADTNINWRGEWQSATQYAFRDAVRWRPDANTAYSSYYCIEANSGHAPPTIATGENEFWSLMTAGGGNGSDGKNGEDSTEPGPAGPPNALTIGTVTAVPNGTAPSATITGTSPNQVLNLKLETGAKGDKGDKGDSGSGGGSASKTLGLIVETSADGVITISSTDNMVNQSFYTFPVAFPTACISVVCSRYENQGDADIVPYDKTNTGFTPHVAGGYSGTVSYIAKGY